MVKSNSRTRKQPKAGHAAMARAAATDPWGVGGSRTELKTFSQSSGNYQLYHNVPAAYYNLTNLLDQVVQGTQSYQRVGNRIFVKELEIFMVLNNKPDRPNVSYRLTVCAAAATTNADSFGELFVSGFTGLHVPTNSQLLYDAAFPLNQGSSMENNMTPNKERSFIHRAVVPINRPVVYNTSDQACTTRLIGFVCSYDAYGTLQTDNIASIAQTSWRLVYTDC